MRAQSSSSKAVTASSSGAARPADSPSSPASARYGENLTCNSEVGTTRFSLAACVMHSNSSLLVHWQGCLLLPGLPALTITQLLSCSQRRHSSCVTGSQHLPSSSYAAEWAGEWPGLGIWGGFGSFLYTEELLIYNACSVGECGAPQLGFLWQMGILNAQWGVGVCSGACE